jgi:hypothetical protein
MLIPCASCRANIDTTVEADTNERNGEILCRVCAYRYDSHARIPENHARKKRNHQPHGQGARNQPGLFIR